MFTIVLPNTSEVWFCCDLRWAFVRENNIIFFENLRCELTKSIPFFFELFSTLWSSSVNSKYYWLLLVAVSEWVKNSISFAIIVRVIKHMATVSPSGWVWDLIVEETGRHASSPLFKSKPLQHVWFLTFTSKLGGSPFRVEIMHCICPRLSWVSIEFPAVLFFSSSPIRNFESFEHGAWISVETNVTHSLKQSWWVEVLRIQVHHNIWLFVELVCVDILHAHAYNNKLNLLDEAQTQQTRLILISNCQYKSVIELPEKSHDSLYVMVTTN